MYKNHIFLLFMNTVLFFFFYELPVLCPAFVVYKSSTVTVIPSKLSFSASALYSTNNALRWA